MEILEGQVYEGCVSALGSEGPQMRWIVVSPFGKRHAHSISDPLELHCMPLGILQQNIERGMLTLVESLPAHPVIRLQRIKETRQLRDTHMGLFGEVLSEMIALLDTALSERADYAPYLAGEILSLVDRSRHSESEIEQLTNRIRQSLSQR